MASLAAAKQLISKRGVAPPPGVSPGTPQFDEWAMAWFNGAIDAGDPEAVKAAGGRAAEEAEGGIADFGGAADPSTWLGQRKPTPRELRRYAQLKGQSEDYARFDDRQLADWIGRKWDVGGGYFTNDFGDIVEKPTESGQKSHAAGYATGEMSAGQGGGGGGGGGKAAAAAPAPAKAEPSFYSPLQELLMNQGGFLRQFDQTPGDETPGIRGGVMGGGGIWYQPGSEMQTRPGTTAPYMIGGNVTPRAGSLPATPRAGLTPPGGSVTNTMPGSQSLSIPAGTPTWRNTSPLGQMLTPLQGQTAPTGLTGSLLAPQQQPGQGQSIYGQGSPLTTTMRKAQAKRPGAWF